jgi:MFS family permease
MRGPTSGLEAAERRFALLFLPVAFGFGARMALVAFNGPLARLFTDNGYLIGLVLAIGPLVAMVANPWFGRLSDGTWNRFGRRLPYALVGLPLSTAILFLIPQSPTYGVLLVLFLLRALTISVVGAPLMSLIPDVVAPARRGRAMALFMVAGGLGAIVIQGAGKIYWEQDFGLVFYLTGVMMLVLAFPPLLFIRETRPPAAELLSARDGASVSPAAIVSSIVSGSPVALFLISASLRYLGIGLVLNYFTLFALTDLSISVGDAALAIAASGLVRLALALPAGRIVDVYDRRWLLVGATVVAGAVHLVTGLFARELWHLYAVACAAAVAGVIDMICSGPLLMDLMPAHRRGVLLGVNMVLGSLFHAAGALLGGAVFAWTGGYRVVFAIAAVAAFASAWILARMKMPEPDAASGQPAL